MKKHWWRWLLVAMWLYVIYWFSAQTGAESGYLSGGITQWLVSHLTPHWETMTAWRQEEILVIWRHLIRKAAHMTEFAVLAALFMNAWLGGGRRTLRRAAVLSSACCFLAAAADEWHQAFVPARGPALGDVFIDFFGALLGILVVWLVVLFCRRRCCMKEKTAFS